MLRAVLVVSVFLVGVGGPCFLRPARAQNVQQVSLSLNSPGGAHRFAPPAAASLRELLTHSRITPIEPGPKLNPQVVELGRMLFYDKIISGNRDTACASCHHDFLATADGLSLSIGTLGLGLGTERVKAHGRKFTPRNAPELFNRGLPEWRTQFWDSRVEQVFNGHSIAFKSPANLKLPGGFFTHVLQVQAMFPVTSRTEMRGNFGDRDVHGNINELALIDDKNFPAMWRGLMRRLQSAEGARNPNVASYQQLFAAAFPRTPPQRLGFEHAAVAMAKFQESAYTLLDSPWDRYVAGDENALTPSAQRGARLFYGNAGCVDCHSGRLFTDQEHYNLLVPHIGSDRLTDKDGDLGRFEETKHYRDRHTFRTPPLRNVAATGPWMHNGAYSTLEAAVRHHLDPIQGFLTYDRRHLAKVQLRSLVKNSRRDLEKMLPTLDPKVAGSLNLTPAEMQDLLSFLHSLTSPSLKDLYKIIPLHVPSGLPVDGVVYSVPRRSMQPRRRR